MPVQDKSGITKSAQEAEFGPFTTIEIQETFRAFDLDSNKFVGALELRKCFESINEEVNDEEMDEMVKCCDLDGDGVISEDEFLKFIFRHAGPPKPVHKDNEQGALQGTYKLKRGKEVGPDGAVNDRRSRTQTLVNLSRALKLQDKNMDAIQQNFIYVDKLKSGKLREAEFILALEMPKTDGVVQLFNLFDYSDPKGFVDWREFLIAFSNLSNVDQNIKVRFAFSQFDLDGNGQIDKDELTKILMATHMATKESEVAKKAAAIMRQGDVDGDGELSYEEFTRVAQRFPNIMFPRPT